MREFFSGLFTPDPGVVDGLLALAVLYALVVGPGRKILAPDEPFEKKRAIYFGIGFLILVGAVATPIDHIGETYLFSVHMLQHVILMAVLPPFLIHGTPVWLSDFLFRTEGLGKVLRFFVHPVVACISFNAALIIWHVPAFYELALRDSFVHLLEHVSFVVVSIFMYWPLLGRRSDVEPMHNGLKILYILAVGLAQLPLFGVITFSPSVLYPAYEKAPRYIEGLTAHGDQVLGGVIMKLVAVIYMMAGFVVYFYRWYRTEQERA
ncbi:MAG: cytochrome c oxidase assembly protein [Vulcanimicrobiota bacterium]